MHIIFHPWFDLFQNFIASLLLDATFLFCSFCRLDFTFPVFVLFANLILFSFLCFLPTWFQNTTHPQALPVHLSVFEPPEPPTSVYITEVRTNFTISQFYNFTITLQVSCEYNSTKTYFKLFSNLDHTQVQFHNFTISQSQCPVSIIQHFSNWLQLKLIFG